MLKNAVGTRDAVSIPGLGRSPGVGNDNPLQYSCLENSMDRGAWQAIVNRVMKSWTWLSNYHTWGLEGKTSPQLPHTKTKVWLGAWHLCPKKSPHQLPLIWPLSVSPACVFNLMKWSPGDHFLYKASHGQEQLLLSLPCPAVSQDGPAVDSQVKKKKKKIQF